MIDKDGMMEGSPAIYQGKIVSKEHFRVFIYSPNDTQRLVESWDEYEASMQSGLWFATKEDAKASISKPIEKPKALSRAKKASPKAKEEIQEPIDDYVVSDAPPDEAAFEVTEGDDFLPKSASK